MATTLAIETRPHYLLELVSPSLKSETGDCVENLPNWVTNGIRQIPYVVVRRGQVTNGLIPIGVRGSTREQRCAAFVSLDQVARVITPVQLRQQFEEMHVSLRPTSGAMSTLKTLSQNLSGNNLHWGPGGSVGFELATRSRTASESSDLDIVIYADHLIPLAELQALNALVPINEAKVDIQIESPTCGFSLAEYVDQFPREILLKTPFGARLGSNPWA